MIQVAHVCLNFNLYSLLFLDYIALWNTKIKKRAEFLTLCQILSSCFIEESKYYFHFWLGGVMEKILQHIT